MGNHQISGIAFSPRLCYTDFSLWLPRTQPLWLPTAQPLSSNFHRLQPNAQANASPTIQNTTITKNAYAGIYASSASPTLVCNNIYANSIYGLYNATAGVIVNAENQWWGSATGPYHPTTNPSGTGNGVTDGVDYSPWLLAPCGTPSLRIFLPLILR